MSIKPLEGLLLPSEWWTAPKISHIFPHCFCLHIRKFYALCLYHDIVTEHSGGCHCINHVIASAWFERADRIHRSLTFYLWLYAMIVSTTLVLDRSATVRTWTCYASTTVVDDSRAHLTNTPCHARANTRVAGKQVHWEFITLHDSTPNH